MNIDNFILTVSISLAIGLLAGFFLRDFLQFLAHLYKRFVRKPKHFQRTTFKNLDTLTQDETHGKND